MKSGFPVIHLYDQRWKKALFPYRKTICAIVGAISELSYPPAVVLADDEFVHKLNLQYRGKNKATNVLSFANDQSPPGDIILAYETIAEEAAEQGKTFRHHAAHLIIHGALHLLNYDHETKKQAAEMEKKEINILKKLGIANPYC